MYLNKAWWQPSHTVLEYRNYTKSVQLHHGGTFSAAFSTCCLRNQQAYIPQVFHGPHKEGTFIKCHVSLLKRTPADCPLTPAAVLSLIPPCHTGLPGKPGTPGSPGHTISPFPIPSPTGRNPSTSGSHCDSNVCSKSNSLPELSNQHLENHLALVKQCSRLFLGLSCPVSSTQH